MWCFSLVLRHMGVFVALPTVVVGVFLILITLAVFAHAIYTATSEVRGSIDGDAEMSSAATAAAVTAVENAAAAAVGEVKTALEKQLASLRRLASRGLNANNGADERPGIATEVSVDNAAPIDQAGIVMVPATTTEEKKEENQGYWAQEYLCGVEEEKA